MSTRRPLGLVGLVLAVGLVVARRAEGGHVQHVEPTTLRRVTAAFLPGESWRAWHAVTAALFALPAESPEEAALFSQCTGRSSWPTAPAREAWLIVGRRGGKSRLAAVVTVYLALFRHYALAPGERGVVMLIASDRRQARIVKRYVVGLLDAVPALAAKVTRRTAEAIDFDNAVSIEIHTASFRAVRGYSVVAAVLDEIAFWPTDDAAEPDSEIVAALRPAMATTPGSLLLAISSPYARRGELWRAWRAHFGKDGDDVLVWQAPTRVMNPTVPQAVIDRALAEDEAAARAEWLAEFRRDVESFISREALEAAVVPGRLELPPASGVSYRAFLDFAGGSGGDSASLAIAHAETRGEQVVAVLDLVREVRPPFSPDQVCVDFAATLRLYGVVSATADRWGGQFPVERMAKLGIRVEPSEKVKSELYRDFLPWLTSGRIELLQHPRLLAQLAGLERRTARGGRDTIDHGPGPGARDDVCNSACGAILLSASAASLVPACGRFSDAGASPGSELAARVRAMSQARLRARSARLWRE